MSNERKHDDMVYQMAISVAKNMLKNGIVNREDTFYKLKNGEFVVCD